MKTNKYHSIDKTFFVLGAKLPFEVFQGDQESKAISILLYKDKKITPEDLEKVRRARELYIAQEEKISYDDYAISHLKSISKERVITFSQKAKVILDKAQSIMQRLFSDPNTLGHIGIIKEVVDELVMTILDDDFSIRSILELASHDYYTHTHSINVTIYAISLGKHLKISATDLKTLGEAALMHDLGKSKIRADIINKKGKLTTYEFEYMKHHSEWSYDIARNMGVTDHKILEAIRHHHEKLDGTGYPDHATGREISLFARIICICDIFDALTTKRSYKDPVTTFDTLKMMKEQMAHQVDTRLVNSFILMMHQD